MSKPKLTDALIASRSTPMPRGPGRPRAAKVLTLREGGLRLLHFRREEGRRPRSIGRMGTSIVRLEESLGRQRLAEHPGAAWGPQLDLATLTVHDVAAYANARRAAGVTNTTINNELGTLRSILYFAILDDKTLDALPVQIRKLKTPRPKAKVLESADDFGRLLSACDRRLRIVFLLALHLGLRHGEIAHLQRRDLVFEKATDDTGELQEECEVLVRAKTWKVRGGYATRTWDTKTGEPHSGLVRGPQLLAELAAYLEAMPNKAPDAWLFPGYDGPVHGFYKEVRAAFRVAGLYDRSRKPGLHMLRKTFATDLLNPARPGGQVDMETAREAGGWSDYGVMRHYLTSNRDRKRRVAASQP